MQTEKAKALNDYFIDLFSFFHKEHFLKTQFHTTFLSESKQAFNQTELQKYINNFHEELKCNIIEYKDINIIHDYLQIYYKPSLAKATEFELVSNYEIIRKDIEVSYFLNLKKEISEKYNYMITLCNFENKVTPYSNELIDFINDVFYNYDFLYYIDNAYEKFDYSYEKYKNQFNFSVLSNECAKLETTHLKHELINKRLAEFHQWQLQFDDFVYNKDHGSYRPLTTKYFSKFEDQCKLEIQQLEKILQFATKTNTDENHIKNTTSPSPFKWNSTDTDFLELFAALYQNESIVRADGNPLTRKELLDYFQGILGLEIKDVEGKLTRAGNRNENTAFLDSLAQQFRNYVAEKEKKQTRRK